MSKWWVVNKNAKTLIACFDEAEKKTCSIGFDQEWLEVPEEVAPGNCKVVEDEEGALLLEESSEKSGPKWDFLRAARNKRLSDCDWTQLADSPLSEEQKTAWATYRQDLRDVPQNCDDPDSPDWPSIPE